MLPPSATTRSKILIVDDEPANVRLLERLLLTGGFTEVRSTTDARLAIDLFEEFQPDLIMLDLNMPHVDGFTILADIRARRPSEYLPVLVLTADIALPTKERALTLGASDFLTKPFERTEVLLRTRNLLESRYLHRVLREKNRELETKLVHQAFHDALTGLANRALFHDRVEHAAARSIRGDPSVLLMIDLDDFKVINDTYGHGEGDRVLRVIAQRLTESTRSCDTVARYGGDEFAILLEDVHDVHDVHIVVNRIIESVGAPIAIQGGEVTVGVSIGVAHAGPHDTVTILVRNADVALYRAKDAGKGRYAVFDPSMYDELLTRLQLEAGLRHAEDRGELRVVYQPIVSLASGTITGVEALARWQLADREIQPAEFIPIAEATGLIVSIGRWVMREACHQARRWQLAAADGIGPSMSVNVSSRQLQEPSFAADVAAVLAETQLTPERLILEITESVLIADSAAVGRRLHELKALGVRLAMDDFGTGYSNLGYLQRIPLDILKIDRSFVARVSDGGSADATLTSIIVDIAAALKLHTVAEGIEHTQQRDHMLALGCGSGQGFLFARPVVAETVTDWLKAGGGLHASAAA